MSAALGGGGICTSSILDSTSISTLPPQKDSFCSLLQYLHRRRNLRQTATNASPRIATRPISSDAVPSLAGHADSTSQQAVLEIDTFNLSDIMLACNQTTLRPV